MNKALTIAIASIISVASVSGFAYAQEGTSGGSDTGRDTVTKDGKTVTTDGSDPTGQTTESSTTATTGAAAAAASSDVNIVLLSALENDKDQTNAAETMKMKANDAANMKMVQDELMKDQALVDALKAQNVQIENVIDVQTAATGGKTVYVK